MNKCVGLGKSNKKKKKEEKTRATNNIRRNFKTDFIFCSPPFLHAGLLND